MTEDEIDALALAVANELRDRQFRKDMRPKTAPPPPLVDAADVRHAEVPRTRELGSYQVS